MPKPTIPPPKLTQLYDDYAALEVIEAVGRGATDRTDTVAALPGFSERARTFLRLPQGVAAVRLWVKLAQPTIDALRAYVELDMQRPDSGDEAELTEAAQAAEIALRTFKERIEFLATRDPSRMAS